MLEARDIRQATSASAYHAFHLRDDDVEFVDAGAAPFLADAAEEIGAPLDFDDDLLERWLEEGLDGAEDEGDHADDRADGADDDAIDLSDSDSDASEAHADLGAEVPAPVPEMTRHMLSLGVEEGPNHTIIHTETDTILGTVEWVFVGVPFIKCVCGRHNGCQVFCSTHVNYMMKWKGCLAWLAKGLTMGREEHLECLDQLKREFGVRPRGRRG